MREWEQFWEKYKLPDFLRNAAQQSHPIRTVMAEECEVGETVLDVACSSAMSYPYFAMAGVKYVGVDFTTKFLDLAREMYPEIELHEANAIDLPFDSLSFDVACCKDLLEHVHPDDVEKVIKGMWRVARRKIMIAFFLTPIDESAEISFVNGQYYNNRYDKREILKLIQSLEGFDDLHILSISNKAVRGYTHSPLYVVTKK